MGKKPVKFMLMAPYAGFFMLAALIVLLYSVASYELFLQSGVSGFVSIPVLLTVIAGLVHEYKNIGITEKPFLPEDIVRMGKNTIAVMTGAITVYLLHAYAGLDAVVASALTGILAAVAAPAYAAAVFCGSFAGMSSGDVLNIYEIALAGFATAVIFNISESVFKGMGGKLGTMAFTGCAIILFTTGGRFLSIEIPGVERIALLAAFSMLGALTTYLIHTKTMFGPVAASAIVGIAAGTILPLIFAGHGTDYAVMAYCASFAGMSSRQRMPSWIHMAAAGLICAFAYIFTPGMHGAGGKLGAIAFGSVLGVRGALWISGKAHIKEKGSKQTEQQGG